MRYLIINSKSKAWIGEAEILEEALKVCQYLNENYAPSHYSVNERSDEFLNANNEIEMKA